jgi:hypothetical protein
MSQTEEAKETRRAEGCCESQLRDWAERVEKCAEREPVKCAAIAFLAGVVLTVLPIGQIVGGVTRLVLGLIRPVLVVLGAMKLFEEFDKRR